MISKRLLITLLLLSAAFRLCALDFMDPAKWQANSSGKMNASFDPAEKAVKITTVFKPGTDYWVYPKFEFLKLPPETKTMIFEIRAIQSADSAGYRCGYVMFTGDGKKARYLPQKEWQTVTIDLDSVKIEREKVKGIQIGLNPQSAEVTYWFRNLQFLDADGKPVKLIPKESPTDSTPKAFTAEGKWGSLANAPVIAKPTGFFQVIEKDGRWWFADPEGKPFYSVGLNYCLGVQLEWRPNPAEFQKRFSLVEDQCRILSRKFKEWQFNTCGTVGGNWNGRFPVTPIFRIVEQARQAMRKGEIPKSEKHDFFDVYSPEFAALCDAWAQRVIRPEADNPLIVGWFIDNEFHLPQDEPFQEKFYETVVAAIRRYDKNHLLLGIRYESPNRSDLDIRMDAKYSDVITVNYYDYPHNRAAFDRIYQIARKPILIGEFTVAAKESGITNSKFWPGGLFENQVDRALGYERFASEMAALPYIVGTHYFMLTDRFEPGLNNWGLRDLDGKFYYDFVRRLSQVNERLPLIHAGELAPPKFPDLKCAVNDNPQTINTARIADDGKWLWQVASYYYRCTPGTHIYFSERTNDEDWGLRKDGFIEYRFTLKEPIRDAYFIIRYAASKANTLNLEINDESVAVISCPPPGEDSTSPPGWAYGFGRMKLGTVSVPLHINIPAGVTSVRLIAAHPWKAGNGIRMQGFFLSSSPARISRNNYYGLDLGQR